MNRIFAPPRVFGDCRADLLGHWAPRPPRPKCEALATVHRRPHTDVQNVYSFTCDVPFFFSMRIRS